MKAVDEQPVLFLALVWLLVAVGLILGTYLAGPILLGAAGATKRTAMYSQIATMAIAVMAATLTVLSILVAMPDRPRVQALRSLDGWKLLQGMLLATGGVCLAAVVTAELGLAFDASHKPHQLWLESWCVASVTAAALGTFVSGIAFALVLKAAARDDEALGGSGRGSDPAFQ
ncbi:MAG TPA: hypothetical protein VJP39_01135 [Gaiellaceae bacterium]|nr:hypothetical protein [Gaiellaceae bacterium]